MKTPCAILLALVCVLLAASPAAAATRKPLPALTPARADALTRALARGQLTEAQYALERAVSLFDRARVSARFGQVSRPDPREATLILRDLSIRLRSLSGADRQRAEALLARPTDSPNDDDPDNSYSTPEQLPDCGTFVCVHFVTTTADAVDTTDANVNSIPDYVDQVLDVFDNQVWGEEVTTMGYRQPKSDMSSANDGSSLSDVTGTKFDVYLTNLGDDGLYGYCMSDDPNLAGPPTYSNYDMSAYCVVDNNYTEQVFSGQTPVDNLKVTAAHEFFHAIQAAYDWFEDRWIMEATATWMEDEVYTDVNDNLQYLSDSPLAKPGIPLDKGPTNADPCCHVYGDWIYFRFLSEWFGPSAGVEDQTVVEDIWERLDGSPSAPDDYSILGIRNVAATRGTNFRKLYGNFGWINRISRSWYDEGQANSYPQSPLAVSPMTLSRSAPSRSKAPTLLHQTNRYYEFRRGSGVSSTAKLKLVLDLPSLTMGSDASALVFKKTGAIVVYRFSLSGLGNGTFKVPFGSAISKVDLILTNGSGRYSNCWAAGTPYACSGHPLDDGRIFKFTARLA